MRRRFTGGRNAVEQQEHQKEVVVRLLIQLAHWAETNCKDDMTAFLSSGFQAAVSTRATTPPVSETIRKSAQGTNSGQLVVTLMKFPGAASYEVRWAQAPAGGGMPANVDQPTAGERQDASHDLRPHSRHDLRHSGTCRDQIRLYRLWPACNADGPLALSPIVN
jgi:hypothetical protein